MTKWISQLLLLIFLAISSILYLNQRVVWKTQNQTFDSISELPSKKVALVLGTSKYISNGQTNLFYKYRIDAAVRLYKEGKIKFILISGDNGTHQYNEPKTFKADLISRGIPEEVIFLDYAGFRTLDSIVRCKLVFGEEDIIVISQKFHNERAIYLAQANGIKAIGFNAQDINGRYGIRTHLREYAARVKMFIDIWIGKEPKFLGEKIIIE
ncbi:MAG: YdcF family protein [Bacteroidia bacterium]|nr:YdcF family protein [Bacteroidia bacterium]NNJ56167.1 DUF218 domain-containing protein [Bacteroidia bacterium]